MIAGAAGSAARRRPAVSVPALLAAVGLLATAPATAHIVYGGPSLAGLVASAEVVARARIVAPATAVPVGDGDARPAVVAELLEVYKGEAAGRVRFAQHGHGVAPFEAGEEVLLFLLPIERSPELAALAGEGALRWVSLQEHDAKFALGEGSRGTFAEAVRAYVALEEIGDSARRIEAHRELVLRLLGSPEERLATAALRDLVLGGETLLPTASVPRLLDLVDDPAVAVGIRLGVLAELDRPGRLPRSEADRRWARLLRTVGPPDLRAAIRAAGAHPGPAVTAELVRLLDSGGPGIAEAAAVALGAPGHGAGVAPLADLLERAARALRMAAVRGLGGIATPEAVAALRAAAAGHPDPETRRRAAAELRRLAAPAD